MANLGEIKVCFIIYGYFFFLSFIEMLKYQRNPEAGLIIKQKQKNKKSKAPLALGV